MYQYRKLKFRYFKDGVMHYQKPGDFFSMRFDEKGTVLKDGEYETQEFMQFTDVKTKDGQEIYEGDIILLGSHHKFPKTEGKIGVVKWKEDSNFYAVEFQWSKDQYYLMMDGDVAFLGKV